MAFQIINLKKQFGDKTAVNNISLSINEGEILGMLGRNGAGKTTTIRMMLDLIPKDGGQILWKNEPFSKEKVRIGYLPEERGLYPKMNALDQIIYFGMLEGMSRKDARAQSLKWLKRLEIEYAEKKRTEQLSKGNQQKIQLITALIHDPEFIILDEPFSGLDPVNAEMLKSVVIDEIKKRKTIIFCSHQMEQVESFCDKVSIMKDGNLIINDTIENIKKTYDYRYLDLLPNKPIDEYLLKHELNFTKEKELYRLKLPKTKDYLNIVHELENKHGLRTVTLKEPSLHQIFIERTGDA